MIADNTAGTAKKPVNAIGASLSDMSQPPIIEPITGPERSAAFAQLTPVARQLVG